jgi:CheY-like chemotaxis protein
VGGEIMEAIAITQTPIYHGEKIQVFHDNWKALVIEDDFFSKKLFGSIILDNLDGVDVFYAKDYESAIELLNEGELFSLVIIDINLEGTKNGIDIYKAIEKSKQNPIVIMTSTYEPTVYKSFFSKGLKAPPYLKKPFSPLNCMYMIEALIEEKFI